MPLGIHVNHRPARGLFFSPPPRRAGLYIRNTVDLKVVITPPKGQVMRRKDKALTELADIEAVILESPYVTLGLTDNGETYMVPLDFGYKSDGKNPGALYFHCARSGRKLDIMSRNPEVSLLFVAQCALFDEGDGDLACTLSTAYRSVMALGKARIIEDEAQKTDAMRIILQRYGCEGRQVAPEKLAKTALVRVDLTETTGKTSKPKSA